MKKLYRSRDNKYLFGVCGGIGEYFNMDPTIVRLFFVLLSLLNAVPSIIAAVVFYLVAWLIIPEESPGPQEEKVPEAKKAKPKKGKK